MAKHAKHAVESNSSSQNTAAKSNTSPTGRHCSNTSQVPKHASDPKFTDDDFDFLGSTATDPSKADSFGSTTPQDSSDWDDLFESEYESSRTTALQTSALQSKAQNATNTKAQHIHTELAPQSFDIPGKASRKKNKGKGNKVVLIVLILVLLCVLGAGAVVIFKPKAAQPYLLKVQEFSHIDLGLGNSNETNSTQSDSSSTKSLFSGLIHDSDNTAQNIFESRTRLIAQCQGVDIYSPIAQKDITGVLFHQASYEWGQVLTTELPEADLSESNVLPVNNEQTEGEWADVEVAHLYRVTDDTDMDTSIDVGAKAGTVVHAPVTGTVIAVIDYNLYDEIPDVQIHIRPDANPDLDVVLLHQYDPQVKKGDQVEGGVTEISYVRDIASALTDIQLGFYTEESDPGNHSHIQVNDLTNEAYVEKYGLEVD